MDLTLRYRVGTESCPPYLAAALPLKSVVLIHEANAATFVLVASAASIAGVWYSTEVMALVPLVSRVEEIFQ